MKFSILFNLPIGGPTSKGCETLDYHDIYPDVSACFNLKPRIKIDHSERIRSGPLRVRVQMNNNNDDIIQQQQ